MTLQADFTSQDFFRNPAAAIENLRRMGPVVEVRFPIIGKVWATTTQALADQVLKDTDTFTIRRDDGNVAGLQWWMPGIVRTLANSMLSMDEPDHKRLRDIVDEAFRRRAVLDMEPHIQAIGDPLADELFAEGSPADLVERFARKLPLSVICELLGLPLADRAKFTAWASGFTRFTGALGFLGMMPKIFAMRRYVEQHLETVRRQGGQGLIAEIVRVEKDGGKISRDEIVSMVFLLLFAGHETTTHLISGSAFELLKNPGLRDWLRGGLEPARSGGRGISALHHAGAIHQAALCAPGCRSRRRAGEEGRQGHGDAGRRQHGPASQSASGAARPAAQAEPPHRVRHRDPFLPRPSAGADRRPMRAEIAVPALARPGAGGRSIRNQMAQAARPAGDRPVAGCGGSGKHATRVAYSKGSGNLVPQPVRVVPSIVARFATIVAWSQQFLNI